MGRKTDLSPADKFIRTAEQLCRSSDNLLGERPTYRYSAAVGRLLAEKLLRHPNTCRRVTHRFRNGHVQLDIDGMTFTWPDADGGHDWWRRLTRFGALILAPPRAEHSEYAWFLYVGADALAPEVEHEAKLVLTGLGVLLFWPDVRRIERAAHRAIRIRHRPFRV